MSILDEDKVISLGEDAIRECAAEGHQDKMKYFGWDRCRCGEVFYCPKCGQSVVPIGEFVGGCEEHK
jgi:hypothetical protein